MNRRRAGIQDPACAACSPRPHCDSGTNWTHSCASGSPLAGRLVVLEPVHPQEIAELALLLQPGEFLQPVLDLVAAGRLLLGGARRGMPTPPLLVQVFEEVVAALDRAVPPSGGVA